MNQLVSTDWLNKNLDNVKILDANQVYIRTAEELKNNPHILCKFNS